MKGCIVKKMLLAAFALLLLAPGGGSAEKAYPSYYGKYGSAPFIGGKTVVISIFADDAKTSWHFPAKTDAEKRMLQKIHDRMKIGFEWIEKQTARYGVKSEFIWDYEKLGYEAGLNYYAAFEQDIFHGGFDAYLEIWDYIHQQIDVQSMLNHYQADNIVFAVHLNAPNNQDYQWSFAWPANYRKIEPHQVWYEVIVYVPYGKGRENTPALYAHEMLHVFGANDLYTSGSIIPQAYVDYLENNKIWDIMNSNYSYYCPDDRIINQFIDVNAYYCGLIKTCDDVRRFGLGPSVFEWEP